MSEPFPETYLRFVPSVRAKCRRLLGPTDDAEDVAQESFVRLWEGGPDPEREDVRTVLAWLYRTSTRLCIDRLRRRNVRYAGPIDDDTPCGTALETAVVARDLIFRLRSTAGADEVEAAVLCRVDGLAHVEAGDVLGVSERTIRRLLQRFDDQSRSVREELLP